MKIMILSIKSFLFPSYFLHVSQILRLNIDLHTNLLKPPAHTISKPTPYKIMKNCHKTYFHTITKNTEERKRWRWCSQNFKRLLNYLCSCQPPCKKLTLAKTTNTWCSINFHSPEKIFPKPKLAKY